MAITRSDSNFPATTTPPHALGWLDTVDAPLDMEARVRLAAGATAVQPGSGGPANTTRPAPTITLPDRRFVWARLQKGRNNGMIFVVGLALFYATLALLNEFDRSLRLTGFRVFLLAVVLLGVAILWLRLAELLPFTRSSARLHKHGVGLSLFYGRQVTGRAVFSNRLQDYSFGLPRFTTIPWAEIDRLGLYTAVYQPRPPQPQPYAQLFWVKLWRKDGRGYVALVTADAEDARTFCDALAAHAGLEQWALLNERGVSPMQRVSTPVDQRSLALWELDQERVRGNLPAEVSLLLWRDTALPTASEAHKARWSRRWLLLPLLLVAVGAGYFLLNRVPAWTPPGPRVNDPVWLGLYGDAGNTGSSAQTLIPSLHEVWNVPLSTYSYSDDSRISVAGGRLLVGNQRAATVVDANTGRLMVSYDLANLGADSGLAAPILSPDGRYLYYVANQYVGSDKQNDINFGGGKNPHLIALDIDENRVVWEVPVGADAVYRQMSEPAQIVVAYTDPGSLSQMVEAINPSNGLRRWRREISRLQGANQLAAAKLIYVYTNGNEVLALDPADGQQRWRANVPNKVQRLLADEQAVNLVGDTYIQPIDSNSGALGSRVGTTSDSYNNDKYRQAAQVDGVIYALSEAEGFSYNRQDTRVQAFRGGSEVWSTDYKYKASGNQQSNMVASGGLLYFVSAERSMFGNSSNHLYALDQRDGREVWKSGSLDDTYNVYGPVVANGRLYLVSNGRVYAYEGVELGRLHHCFINVAPQPILARLERLDDRVGSAVEMRGGVLVLRRVAAADVSALHAEAQMYPLVAGSQAILAAVRAGHDFHDLVEMGAGVLIVHSYAP